jgi:hypothetical protein
MDRWRVARNVALFLVALGVAVVVVHPPLWLVSPGEYETATVTAVDANGSRLATVDVRIADTDEKRRIGLSRTDALEFGSGMLFVFAAEDTYAFHMEGMAFPLDIVFLDANGTVRTVHHAPVPANATEGADARYPGRGKYVLEVPRGWTNATGFGVGDRLEIPEGVD